MIFHPDAGFWRGWLSIDTLAGSVTSLQKFRGRYNIAETLDRCYFTLKRLACQAMVQRLQ